ncbi:MAG TPA: DMT family transporter [Anaerolineales bacterium]
MPILAIVLLLASAVLHALWNLLLKQSSEKYVAMGWQVIISGIISVFVLFFSGLPPRSMWLFALISMTLEAIYFVLLSFAYSDHDFSLVYPIARGAAPALVVLWSFVFLREIPSMGGFIGIATIICGLVIIGATSFFQPHEGKPKFKGIAIALSIALVISVYTLIDGFAVKHGPVLAYGLSMFTMVPLLTTPVIVGHYGRDHFMEAWQRQPARLVLVGFLGVIAYLFALFAYSMAPVNYSEAIREVSVVIGAFAGWQFLGEKLGKIRVLGAAVIFAGIVLIAVFG